MQILENLAQIDIDLADRSGNGQYRQEAIDVLGEIVSQGWDTYDTYDTLAVLYEKQGQLDSARQTVDTMMEKFGEDGYDLPADAPDPLERLIAKEERREQYRMILSCLTEKQRQVYILFHIKGYKKVQMPIFVKPCNLPIKTGWSHRMKRIKCVCLKLSRI